MLLTRVKYYSDCVHLEKKEPPDYTANFRGISLSKRHKVVLHWILPENQNLDASMDSTDDETEVSKRQDLQLEEQRDQDLSSDELDDNGEEPSDSSTVSTNQPNQSNSS